MILSTSGSTANLVIGSVDFTSVDQIRVQLDQEENSVQRRFGHLAYQE
jgi:hypothetical protein